MAKDLADSMALTDGGGHSHARGKAKTTNGQGADLTVERILELADRHYAIHGVWPEVGWGIAHKKVAGAPGDSWRAIDRALALGLRGLSGNSSLATVLAEHRGVPLRARRRRYRGDQLWVEGWEQCPVNGPHEQRRRRSAPSYKLTIAKILAWADDHYRATGRPPTESSGRVHAAPYKVAWSTIDKALCAARYDLPANTSLSKLLATYRGHWAPLTVERILALADAHHAAHGRWPTSVSGPIAAAPGYTWRNVNLSLVKGYRGLPGGTTLRRLLADRQPPPYRPRYSGTKAQ
jgi:hypothetical protein